MQGPPGGGGWNPGGGPPAGGGWNPGGGAPTPAPSQPGTPARTVALSAAELASAQGTPPPGGAPPGFAPMGAPPSAPGAPPYGGAPPQAVAQPVDAKPVPTNVGIWIGLLFFAVGTMACLVTGAAAAMLGESQSVMVSYLGVPLALAGLVAPLAGAIARGQSQPVAIGAPIGCGCVTMIVAMMGLVVFYTAIWPSL